MVASKHTKQGTNGVAFYRLLLAIGGNGKVMINNIRDRRNSEAREDETGEGWTRDGVKLVSCKDEVLIYNNIQGKR